MKLVDKLHRMLIQIEYDGFNYSGWQKQDNAISIQGELEKAAKKLTNRDTLVQGSGRTDAGVHAFSQAAHLDVPKNLSERSVVNGMNSWLKNKEISVLSAKKVDNNFHARFDAKERTYIYRILNRSQHSALDRHRVWHHRKKLDFIKMHEASFIFIGKHDFSSFRSSICQSKSPVKTINSITVEKEGEEIIFTIKARSFLHHQVRNFVGSLSLVGIGKWEKEDLVKVLNACDRTEAGPTAPPYGLYLADIKY